MEMMKKNTKSQWDKTVEERLKQILDFHNTGYIAQYRFSEFLKGYGPFYVAVTNVQQKIFFGCLHFLVIDRERQCVVPRIFIAKRK
jgi:hypothetical protein